MAAFPSCRLQAVCGRGLVLLTLLVLQLGENAFALRFPTASAATARRLLAGAGPNPFCPDGAFPNQCFNSDGSSYVCCQGSCGATVNNQASCADGISGPTSSFPPVSTPSSTPPTSSPSSTPPSSTPSSTPPSPTLSGSTPSPTSAPALPRPTPAGGAPSCPSGPFQNACFTPNGDAYICCTGAGCGPSNQASNTASCADNKYLPIVPAIYVFGDSLVDSGNSQYLGNGDGLPFPPSPPYFPSRFTNGPVVVDYIAEYLGLPLAPPILRPGASFFRGANFASQGSGALNTTGTPGRVLPLAAQVGLFLGFEANAVAYYATPDAAANPNPPFPPPSSFPASLYVIVTGGNDFRNFAGNATQFQALATAYVTQIAASVQTLYLAGARVFLVGNLPQLGCIPAVRTLSPDGSCSVQTNVAVAGVNAALKSALAQLRGALPGVAILELDLFSVLAAPLNVPGVTNFNQACCGAGGPANTAIFCGFPGFTVCSNPETYFFYDGLHPTTQVDAAVANEVINGNTFVSPSNLYQTLVAPN